MTEAVTERHDRWLLPCWAKNAQRIGHLRYERKCVGNDCRLLASPLFWCSKRQSCLVVKLLQTIRDPRRLLVRSRPMPCGQPEFQLLRQCEFGNRVQAGQGLVIFKLNSKTAKPENRKILKLRIMIQKMGQNLPIFEINLLAVLYFPFCPGFTVLLLISERLILLYNNRLIIHALRLVEIMRRCDLRHALHCDFFQLSGILSLFFCGILLIFLLFIYLRINFTYQSHRLCVTSGSGVYPA